MKEWSGSASRTAGLSSATTVRSPISGLAERFCKPVGLSMGAQDGPPERVSIIGRRVNATRAVSERGFRDLAVRSEDSRKGPQAVGRYAQPTSRRSSSRVQVHCRCISGCGIKGRRLAKWVPAPGMDGPAPGAIRILLGRQNAGGKCFTDRSCRSWKYPFFFRLFLA
jgi:hypothetical protein